jgi:two-component system chemotaxis response regulator CheY
MDITMPNLTGIEALMEIIQYDSKAKVVMISAMGQEAMVKQAVMNGASSFVVKPFKEEQVIKVLNQLS